MTIWRMIELSVLLFFVGTASAQQADAGVCGSLQAAYGPYDYRTERDGRLKIVERFHFSPQVEGLVRGDSGAVGDDLNYVLMTSPNHHRALIAMVRLSERSKSSQPPGAMYSVDCYFERAIRFQKDDTVVREIYADYLANTGRAKEAAAQLEAASRLAKDNPLSHYNIGLIYFELKDYDHALAEAHIASLQGYARPDLSAKLKSVGKWRDPPPSAANAASAAAADPAATAASASP